MKKYVVKSVSVSKKRNWIQIATLFISLMAAFSSLINVIFNRLDKNVEYDKESNVYIVSFFKNETFSENVGEDVDEIDVDSDNILYYLCTSDDISNYSDIFITNYLHVFIKNSNEEIIDSIFIELPDLYRYTESTIKNTIVSFDEIEVDFLSDAIFKIYLKQYNCETNDIYINSNIIYKISCKYITKKNKSVNRAFFVSRKYSVFGDVNNDNLFVDSSLYELFDDASSKHQVYSLKTIKNIYRKGLTDIKSCTDNTTDIFLKEVFNECESYINDFQAKYKLLDYIKNQEDSTR